MIIVVAHNKGGVGKTTLSMNLAATMKPDIVIDQDLHHGLSVLSELREKAPSLEVLVIQNSGELIKVFNQSNDGKVILVDCGGFDADINRMAIAAANLIIVPANDEITEVIGLKNFNRILEEISSDMEVKVEAKVLLTKVNPTRKKFDAIESFVSQTKNLSMMKTIIPRRKEYPTALQDGLGVVECKSTKNSIAAKEIKQLVKEINSLVK